MSSLCWQCPAGHLSRCLVVQYHCDFPVGNLFLILSRWGLHWSPREGPTAMRWSWLGWAGTGTLLRAMTPFPEGYTLILAFSLPGSDARRRVRGAGRWVWGVVPGCSQADTLQACKCGNARQQQTGCGSREESDLFLFYFILKADLHSNAIWCFEGNNFVCPNLCCCCFRKTIVLLINSWYKTSVVFRNGKLIMGTEAESSSEPHTQWCICLN